MFLNIEFLKFIADIEALRYVFIAFAFYGIMLSVKMVIFKRGV